jgi:hypothetical protein
MTYQHLTAMEYAAYCNYELALKRGNRAEAALALDELRNGERRRKRAAGRQLFALDEKGRTMAYRTHDRGRLSRDEEIELEELPPEELMDHPDRSSLSSALRQDPNHPI